MASESDMFFDWALSGLKSSRSSWNIDNPPSTDSDDAAVLSLRPHRNEDEGKISWKQLEALHINSYPNFPVILKKNLNFIRADLTWFNWWKISNLSKHVKRDLKIRPYWHQASPIIARGLVGRGQKAAMKSLVYQSVNVPQLNQNKIELVWWKIYIYGVYSHYSTYKNRVEIVKLFRPLWTIPYHV